MQSYREVINTMTDRNLDDEERQKLILEQVRVQMKGIFKLIFGILLFVLPFLSLYLFEELYSKINPEILLSFWGVVIPMASAFGYILFKKKYGKVQRNR
jgi:4-hydroxybenzoate polyprenyltransferase